MSKMYEVEVTYRFYVYADKPPTESKVASAVREAMRCGEEIADWDAREVMSNVLGWEEYCLPYGEGESKPTIGQYFDKSPATQVANDMAARIKAHIAQAKAKVEG